MATRASLPSLPQELSPTVHCGLSTTLVFPVAVGKVSHGAQQRTAVSEPFKIFEQPSFLNLEEWFSN